VGKAGKDGGGVRWQKRPLAAWCSKSPTQRCVKQREEHRSRLFCRASSQRHLFLKAIPKAVAHALAPEVFLCLASFFFSSFFLRGKCTAQKALKSSLS
jgi:uncharacterized protein (DUF2062 family)